LSDYQLSPCCNSVCVENDMPAGPVFVLHFCICAALTLRRKVAGGLADLANPSRSWELSRLYAFTGSSINADNAALRRGYFSSTPAKQSAARVRSPARADSSSSEMARISSAAPNVVTAPLKVWAARDTRRASAWA